MLVYRIEDSEGRGAFREISHLHDMHANLQGLKSAFNHPDPHGHEERGSELGTFFRIEHPSLRARFRFGCRSLHQLRMWFRSPAGRQAMARAGGVMVTYWIPDEHVKHGRYQVAFDHLKATKISTVGANQW